MKKIFLSLVIICLAFIFGLVTEAKAAVKKTVGPIPVLTKIDDVSLMSMFSAGKLIKRKNGQLILINRSELNSNSEFLLYSSKDKGLNWNKESFVSPVSSYSTEVIENSAGELLWLGRNTGNKFFIKKSKNGLDWNQFSSFVFNSSNSTSDNLSYSAYFSRSMGKLIQASDGKYYLLYTDTDQEGKTFLWVSNSTNLKKWSKPVGVAEVPQDVLSSDFYLLANGRKVYVGYQAMTPVGTSGNKYQRLVYFWESSNGSSWKELPEVEITSATAMATNIDVVDGNLSIFWNQIKCEDSWIGKGSETPKAEMLTALNSASSYVVKRVWDGKSWTEPIWFNKDSWTKEFRSGIVQMDKQFAAAIFLKMDYNKVLNDPTTVFSNTKESNGVYTLWYGTFSTKNPVSLQESAELTATCNDYISKIDQLMAQNQSLAK